MTVEQGMQVISLLEQILEKICGVEVFIFLGGLVVGALGGVVFWQMFK